MSGHYQDAADLIATFQPGSADERLSLAAVEALLAIVDALGTEPDPEPVDPDVDGRSWQG